MPKKKVLADTVPQDLRGGCSNVPFSGCRLSLTRASAANTSDVDLGARPGLLGNRFTSVDVGFVEAKLACAGASFQVSVVPESGLLCLVLDVD